MYALIIGIIFTLYTDRRKPLSFYFHYGNAKQPTDDAYGYRGYHNTRIRSGQRVPFDHEFEFNTEYNDKGYVDKTDDEQIIYFAKRDVLTRENIIDVSYAINNKAGISLRTRHYWSGATNQNYYQLQEDGSLTEDSSCNENQDANYDAFTIDMLFR